MRINGQYHLPAPSPMINTCTVLGLLVITTTKSIQSAEAAGRNEYCPGFIDKHGMWNNGFQCRKWGGPGQRYCCGTDSDRFCCPAHQPTQMPSLRTVRPTERTVLHHHVLLATFIFGTLILFTGTAVIMCFHCRCCLVYQRRKRSHREAGNPIDGLLANRRHNMIWGFDLSTSSSRTTRPEFIALRPPSYQEDEPPAYDDLIASHVTSSKEKRHLGFDEGNSQSMPSKCLSSGLCRFNNEAKRLSSKQTTTLLDLDNQVPITPLILASNLKHCAGTSYHEPNAMRGERHDGESDNDEAPNERLLISGRRKEQPTSSCSGVQMDQPFRCRKQEVISVQQRGRNESRSMSDSPVFSAALTTMNKTCQSETEVMSDDACSGCGYELDSEDCVSMASVAMATDSEDEVRRSLRAYVYVNRCR